jgi:hypothetical protein
MKLCAMKFVIHLFTTQMSPNRVVDSWPFPFSYSREEVEPHLLGAQLPELVLYQIPPLFLATSSLGIGKGFLASFLMWLCMVEA